ncbi:MAG: PorT family protein [Sediminibacterium sp.]|nr:PorT family protein [Sediminibacterium sp.]
MKYLVCILLAGGMWLQDAQAQSFKLGVKVGGNMNKIEGQSFNDGFKFAYHAGAFAEINFTKKWGIQPELVWNQMGGVPSDFQSVYGTATNLSLNDLNNVYKLNYLSIPVLLRYTTLGGLFTFNVGPQFGILLQHDKNLLQNGQDAFKSGDLQIATGVQLNLLMLRIYGRYNIGVKNINNIDQRDKWTSQQLQIGLGLKL